MYKLKYQINDLDHEITGITEIVNANSNIVKIKENEYLYNVTENENKIFSELIELLKSWTEIAEKYEINWWAVGGTLLGGVRHEGFIPWDNDIDIGVHYKDYDKLINLSKMDNNFKIETIGFNYSFFPKLFPNIDIFIYDEDPGNKDILKMCGPIMENKNKLWYFGDIFKGEEVKKSEIENVEVVKFESFRLNIPKNADLFLSNTYGIDYKTKLYLSKHVNVHESVSEKLKLRSIAYNLINIIDHYDNEKEDKNKKISFFLANLMLQHFNKEFDLIDILQQIKDFLISRQKN